MVQLQQRRKMGNMASHGASPAKSKAWKGPFSDHEYDEIAAKYDQICSVPKVDAIQAQLQKWLELPLPSDTPSDIAQSIQSMGNNFFQHCQRQKLLEDPDNNSKSMDRDDFVKGVSQLTRASSQAVTRAFFHLFSGDKDVLSSSTLPSLFFFWLLAANQSAPIDSQSKEWEQVAHQMSHAAIQSAQLNSINGNENEIQEDAFVKYCDRQFPLFYSVVAQCVTSKCLEQSNPKYTCPESDASSEVLTRPQLLALSSVTTALQRPIDRIYTTSKDGLSFNRLCYHILGYSGPTLFIIQDTDGAVFGMFCDEEWKTSTTFFGGSGCFLFQLHQSLSIYPIASASSGSMYIHTKGVKLPNGLGMGGTIDNFRLFLGEDLDEDCYASSKGFTFVSGPLSKKKRFTINSMEVYGCGGDESSAKQKAHRLEAQELIDKARKVDKAQFIGSDFDKEMFFGKNFGHGADGRRDEKDES